MINLTAFKKIFNKKEKAVSKNYMLSYKDLSFQYEYTDLLKYYPAIKDEGEKYYLYSDNEQRKVLVKGYNKDYIDNYKGILKDNEFMFDKDDDSYAYKEIDDKKYVVSINVNLLNDEYLDITYFIDYDYNEDDDNNSDENNNEY